MTPQWLQFLGPSSGAVAYAITLGLSRAQAGSGLPQVWLPSTGPQDEGVWGGWLPWSSSSSGPQYYTTVGDPGTSEGPREAAVWGQLLRRWSWRHPRRMSSLGIREQTERALGRNRKGSSFLVASPECCALALKACFVSTFQELRMAL